MEMSDNKEILYQKVSKKYHKSLKPKVLNQKSSLIQILDYVSDIVLHSKWIDRNIDLKLSLYL
jgi:hypothetical protein